MTDLKKEFDALCAECGVSDIRDEKLAKCLDDRFKDLSEARNHFPIPLCKGIGSKIADNASKQSIYFVGNSLGLQSDLSKKRVTEELDVWQNNGITGHFAHPLDRSWTRLDENVSSRMANLVGAEQSEVAICNTLTANLHLLMTSFYRPTNKRYKILYEKRAFPSDQYAFTSQVKINKLDPNDALIQLAPRENEYYLRTEDILKTIEEQGDSIALIIFSGVQYYTGQYFEMEKITAAGHKKGCVVGWDLAHAAGNVPVKLHDWDVDFAAWCTYKYINSGPGSIGGIFVHNKYKDPAQIERFSGWWGNKPETRFEMSDVFDPALGAAGFKLSNPDVLSVASLYGSLEVFEEAISKANKSTITMEPLRNKSLYLTKYLELLLTKLEFYIPANESHETKKAGFTIITPLDPQQRGCQLSLLLLPPGSGLMPRVFDRMVDQGLIGDERHPDVIRLAPTPLYNTFEDVRQAVQIVNDSLNAEILKQ